MNYKDYTESGGVLSSAEFSRLYPKVVTLFERIIADKVPYWTQKSSLDNYGLDINKAIALQIDFVSENGGVDSFVGKSDLMFRSATTSGFSYEVNTDKMSDYYGIPVDPLALKILESQLLRHGYGAMPVW